MLAALLNIPSNQQEWDQWSWHHRLSHDAIRNAIEQQKSVGLTDYELDPIPYTDAVGWLQRNQQTHIEMNAPLKTYSSDLQDVNLQDDKQKQSWIWLHYLEHQTAERVLGIGS